MPVSNYRIIYHLNYGEYYIIHADVFSIISRSVRNKYYYKHAPDHQLPEDLHFILTQKNFNCYKEKTIEEINSYFTQEVAVWKFYSHAGPHQAHKGHKKKLSSQGNSTSVRHTSSAKSSPISCVINNTMCNTQPIIPKQPILD